MVNRMDRPSWDNYFMSMAGLVSTRATCPRKSVGTVIVKDKRVISAGYNGSPSGEPHCIDVGCYMENSHCVRVTHSEANSIEDAENRGVSLKGASLYCNTIPCFSCFIKIIRAGIKEVVYKDSYNPDKRVIRMADELQEAGGFIFRKFEE